MTTAPRIFVVTFILMWTMTILWSLASPVLSSPDESAHAAKAIAQVRGQVIGYRVEGIRQLIVDLPDEYRYSDGVLCYAREPDVSADCPDELGTPNGTNWFATWVSTYNPVYYYIVGWPSLLLGGPAGIYAMRVISGLLGSLLLASAFVAAMAGARRRWMPAGLAFLASPMVVYLCGSVNPQGVEIAAGAAAWIGLLRLLQSVMNPGSVALGRSALWLIVAVSASLLVLARALGPLWLLIILVTAFAFVGWSTFTRILRERSSYPWLAVIAGSGIFSVSWTLGAGSLSGQAEPGDAPLVRGGFLQGAWAMLRDTPKYVEQAIGVFGWLDTYLPVHLLALYFSAAVVLLALAASGTNRRGALRVGIVLGVALAIPPLVQGYSVSQTGLIWQGRYALVLYLGVMIVAAWLMSERADRRLDFVSVRITAIVACLLAVYQLGAFVVALQRYVVGTDEPISAMIRDPRWQPPLGWPLLTVCAGLAAIAIAVWVVQLSRISARDLVVPPASSRD